MNLRKSCLSPGWYPQNPAKIDEFLREFAVKHSSNAAEAVIAAVAPHAGWYYSGALAARAVAALAASNTGSQGSDPASRTDTIAVIGGHNPGNMPVLFASEEAVQTPLGPMEIDTELCNAFLSKMQKNSDLACSEDKYQDNTIEVLLPMVKYFFPKSKLLWLRFPADIRSVNAGKILADTGRSLGRKMLVVGSADLTHYGMNYRFNPKGSGKQALEWVKNVNDKRFIDAVLASDTNAVLERAEREKSSCSAGAVLGVMGYAQSAGTLLDYSTSADIMINEGEALPDSFVGYAAFTWT